MRNVIAFVVISPGAGVATVVISFWLCAYYNVIISWAMMYLRSSFSSTLPWVGCDHEWNDDSCWDVAQNRTGGTDIDYGKRKAVTSTQQFYE